MTIRSTQDHTIILVTGNSLRLYVYRTEYCLTHGCSWGFPSIRASLRSGHQGFLRLCTRSRRCRSVCCLFSRKCPQKCRSLGHRRKIADGVSIHHWSAAVVPSRNSTATSGIFVVVDKQFRSSQNREGRLQRIQR